MLTESCPAALSLFVFCSPYPSEGILRQTFCSRDPSSLSKHCSLYTLKADSCCQIHNRCNFSQTYFNIPTSYYPLFYLHLFTCQLSTSQSCIDGRKMSAASLPIKEHIVYCFIIIQYVSKNNTHIYW